jgi:hypothetical protein
MEIPAVRFLRARKKCSEDFNMSKNFVLVCRTVPEKIIPKAPRLVHEVNRQPSTRVLLAEGL